MAWRPLLLVSATLAAALTVLVLIGLRVLERDRAELFDRYAQAREQGIEEAARGVAGEIADIGDDLDLASILLQSAETEQLAERELHAIATIKREYLVVYARTHRSDSTTKVTAYDAPPGVAAKADATLERLLQIAEEQPGTLHASTAFVSPSDPAAWYRVFARKPKADGPVVAVVVDTAVLLSRMKLQRDAMTRVAVVDATGAAAAVSDRSLAAIAAGLQLGAPSRRIVDSKAARRIGLPHSDAVIAAVPLRVDGGPPWALLTAASTQTLQTQQKTIVRRVLVGSGLVLVLLLSAAAYVLHNTFRARTLREQLRNADRLAHSEKLVTAGQLAAGIAHEIGTPLNVARGRMELSLSHLGNEHREAENHRLVIDQIDRVTRLIQQLLDYVRPAPAMIQDVDLAQSVHAVRDLLAPQAAKRRVALDVDIAPDTSTLKTDPDQVQQIIVNLALNAIDACDKGGKVALRTRRHDHAVVLEIQDTGHGIPRAQQKQVFDPFFTTKKRGQGTGLGLWVVAQLVRAQSAEIELDSSPGQGTTVRVAWPVVS